MSNRVNHIPEPMITKDLIKEKVKLKINIYLQKKGEKKKNSEGWNESKMYGKREKKKTKGKGAKKSWNKK